jgi:hypothetical protein
MVRADSELDHFGRDTQLGQGLFGNLTGGRVENVNLFLSHGERIFRSWILGSHVHSEDQISRSLRQPNEFSFPSRCLGLTPLRNEAR